MPEQPSQSGREALLIRVAPEILALLKKGDVEPVVILGVQDLGDGTYEMILKTPPRCHRDAARRCHSPGYCNDHGCQQ